MESPHKDSKPCVCVCVCGVGAIEQWTHKNILRHYTGRHSNCKVLTYICVQSQ